MGSMLEYYATDRSLGLYSKKPVLFGVCSSPFFVLDVGVQTANTTNNRLCLMTQGRSRYRLPISLLRNEELFTTSCARLRIRSALFFTHIFSYSTVRSRSRSPRRHVGTCISIRRHRKR